MPQHASEIIERASRCKAFQKVHGETFAGDEMKGGNLIGSTGKDVTFSGDVKGLRAQTSEFPGAVFTSECTGRDANFTSANLEEASFVGEPDNLLNLSYWDFTAANMNKVLLRNVRLHETTLNEADVEGIRLEGIIKFDTPGNRAFRVHGLPTDLIHHIEGGSENNRVVAAALQDAYGESDQEILNFITFTLAGYQYKGLPCWDSGMAYIEDFIPHRRDDIYNAFDRIKALGLGRRMLLAEAMYGESDPDAYPNLVQEFPEFEAVILWGLRNLKRRMRREAKAA